MIKRFILTVALVGMVVAPGQAFERTADVGPGKATGKDAVPLDLSTRESSGKKTESGGLIFPGLSTLGVLPKLDFGLELLYGENQPEVVEPDRDSVDSEGLRIKGTLKHRF